MRRVYVGVGRSARSAFRRSECQVAQWRRARVARDTWAMHRSDSLRQLVATRRARLEQACADSGVAFGQAEVVERVLLASDFAYEQWLREPTWLGQLAQ